MASAAYGAVAWDNSTTSSCNGCTTLTWSHTVTGSNTLIVGAGHGTNEPGVITNFTYNSVSMTSVGSASSGGAPGVDVYQKTGVATGSHSCEISLNYGDVTVGSCTSFSGVNQTTPLGSLVAVNQTTLDSGSITVPANGMAYAVALWSNGASGCSYTATPQDGGMTAHPAQLCQASGNSVIGFGSTRTTTGSFVYNSASDNATAMLAIPINPFVSAALVRHKPVLQ